jgi:hypothetical protein
MTGRICSLCSLLALVMLFAVILAIRTSKASTDNDRKTVAALDTEYQAAVKRNDADTMAHPRG